MSGERLSPERIAEIVQLVQLPKIEGRLLGDYDSLLQRFEQVTELMVDRGKAIRDLLAERAELLTELEPKSMETAPIDGTWFLWGQPDNDPAWIAIRWPEYRECWDAPGKWLPLPPDPPR